MTDVSEAEPNPSPKQAQPVTVPAQIKGIIHSTDEQIDRDCYRFDAQQGEEWVIEVNAARSGSALDSIIEVLNADGSPIERVLLQAVRDSYFTFRGKDANQVTDFRVFNWEEMDLNQYLFANGEVVKLWMYPRGPDSGFNVYPGSGNRWGYFDTTPVVHALGEVCYVVQPHPPGTELIPNGLPVFPLYFVNDDGAHRDLGTDSKVHFTAPRDGSYVVRLRDVRGFQGADFAYTLTIRPRQPDFSVSLQDPKLTVHAESAKEFRISAKRIDLYEGPMTVDITGVPEGFSVSTPITIQPGQIQASGVIRAEKGAKSPDPKLLQQIRLTASADIRGEHVVHDVAGFTELKLADNPQLLVSIIPTENGAVPVSSANDLLEFEIVPGETIMLKVRIERNDFTGEVSFGKEDSGRNLPHGVFIDNIGLNGLLLLEGQDEREFFITAADWVPEQSRLFHLRTTAGGGHASQPVMLHVRPSDTSRNVTNATER